MDKSKREAPGSADAIFDAVRPLVDGIAATFGRSCEVVLHDYRDPEHSVIAVAGSVTGRQRGSAMSEIGLRVLAAGDAAQNDVNYLVRTGDGRSLKCSTLPLRDAGGALVGALCINVDVTALARASAVLLELTGGVGPDRDGSTVNFSGDLDQVIDGVVQQAEASAGAPISALSRAGRLEMIRSLQQRGVFEFRGAAVRVATRLGVSRASLYNDLAVVREESPTERQSSG